MRTTERDLELIIDKLDRELKETKDELQIARNDGRTASFETTLIKHKLDEIEKDIAELVSIIETRYVLLVRYMPVEKLVFGLVGLILVTVAGAALALVIR